MEELEVACVLLFDAEGKVIIYKRAEEKYHAGFWEFPRGKVEAGESPQ